MYNHFKKLSSLTDHFERDKQLCVSVLQYKNIISVKSRKNIGNFERKARFTYEDVYLCTDECRKTRNGNMAKLSVT